MTRSLPLRLRGVLATGIIAGVLVLSGCGGGGGAGNEAPSDGVWRAGEGWRLTEEARIGSEDAEGPAAFGQIVDLELDAFGRVWVADNQQYEVRVFDRDGRHVRSLGGKGSGPEEFGGVGGMTWAPDGRLWVLDSGNSRFAVYDTTGALVTTHRRNPAFTPTPWAGRFDRAGRLYDVTSIDGPDMTSTEAVVRLDSALAARDTFRLPPFEGEYFEIRSQQGMNSSVSRVNVPFTGTQLWALDREGAVWVTNTAEYRLERQPREDRPGAVLQRVVEPMPVTAQERQRVLESYAGFVARGGKVDESRFPRYHAALSTFFLDDAGYVWVSPSQRGGARVADVFEESGRYLGRVQMPQWVGFHPAPAIRGTRMAAVAREPSGVESVVLLRIERPGGS